MKKELWTLLAGLALLAPAANAAPTPPTLRLGDVAAPKSYAATLALDARAPRFSGELRIELTFNRATPLLWLNATGLTVESARFEQGGREIPVTVVAGGEDFVGFESRGEPFAAGPAVAVLRYHGAVEPVATRGIFRQAFEGRQYLFTQFEAIDARRAFPCFDEPGWKTPWRLTIDAPAGDVVVSNTPELSATEAPGRPGWTRHEFAPTPPLPTYLVAFAAGPFDLVDGGTAGARKTPLRYVVPKGHAAETRVVRELTPRILELLEEYFGIPFPFDKLDSVAVPQFGGAMENAGLITYGSSWLLARPHEETDEQRRRYTSIGAHEIGHQWFGDYMTLAWWEDIWLNEAFATWIAEKVQYLVEPKWNDGSGRAWSRRRGVDADRLATARRVQNPVEAKGDIMSAFDGITYHKGAEVLSMFEARLGPDKFREGVRLFMRRHAWSSATSADFFRALAEASGRSGETLEAFATFVEQPGIPLVSATLQCRGGRASLQLAQERLRPAGSNAAPMQWSTPACFRYPTAGGGLGTQCTTITGSRAQVELEAPACPDWVVGNAGGIGHYVMRYDADMARRLGKGFAAVPAHEAITLVGDVRLLSDSGLVSLDAALDWADAALGHPAPLVQATGAVLLEKVRDEWLDAKQLARKRDIVARRVLPLAARVGWKPKAGEARGTVRLREVLMPLAAQAEAAQDLRADARALALAWISDRTAVDADVAPAVLDTAARFADAATFAQLERATVESSAQKDRYNLLRAIGKARDPALRERALALTLARQDDKGRINGRDTIDLLAFALDDDTSRRAAFDYVRANFEPLVAKVPADSPVWLFDKMGRMCTRAEREAFTGFFEPRAARFVGGEIAYRKALEGIDLCIAARARPSGAVIRPGDTISARTG